MNDNPRWTEGVMEDGAVILRDGAPVPIEEVVLTLNNRLDPEVSDFRFADRLGALVDEAREEGTENYAKMIGGLVLQAFDLCLEVTALAEIAAKRRDDAR
jgi:hypothetical protein